MKRTIGLALFSLACCRLMAGQAAPTGYPGATGLKYSAGYEEMAQFGQSLGNWHTISPSFTLDYMSGREKEPFDLEYTGGYVFTVSGPDYSTGWFHDMQLKQSYARPKWTVDLKDEVSYRPQAPTGPGETISSTEPSTPSSQTIVSISTHALNNEGTGTVRRVFSRRFEINGSIQDGLLRYPDGNGLDTNSVVASGTPKIHLDARDAITAGYTFSRFTYPGSTLSVRTDMALFGYDREWSRAFHSNVAVGPEWISSSESNLVPSTRTPAVQATLEYKARRMTSYVDYYRGASGGAGFYAGSENETISAGLTGQFTRTFNLGMQGGYQNTSSLGGTGGVSGGFGGAQATWRLGRHIDVFTNYTALTQTTDDTLLPTNVLNAVVQTLSFGISFSNQIRPVK